MKINCIANKEWYTGKMEELDKRIKSIEVEQKEDKKLNRIEKISRGLMMVTVGVMVGMILVNLARVNMAESVLIGSLIIAMVSFMIGVMLDGECRIIINGYNWRIKHAETEKKLVTAFHTMEYLGRGELGEHSRLVTFFFRDKETGLIEQLAHCMNVEYFDRTEFIDAETMTIYINKENTEQVWEG